MHTFYKKQVVGFTCGDLNGIGLEIIIKTLSDSRILDICTPIVFASNKVINFYRKSLEEFNFSFTNIKDFSKVNPKQVNIFNCWEEDVAITPGELNETGGKYAIISLQTATEAAKSGFIDVLVTAPIHKKNVQSNQFNFTGHTPYLQQFFNKEVLMLMTANNLKVALVSEHVPIKDVAQNITHGAIVNKLTLLQASLVKDFGIDTPKIAVLGLNPHSGDEGLVGKEELTIIKPAIAEFKNNTKNQSIVIGPFSSDAFFAQGQYVAFDAVLAMYHDQGLIPFKSLASDEGVNFTAGLPIIRTSPDHGVAFDIAGQNKADHLSILQAMYTGIDIANARFTYTENYKNPLRKISNQILANAVDEAGGIE